MSRLSRRLIVGLAVLAALALGSTAVSAGERSSVSAHGCGHSICPGT